MALNDKILDESIKHQVELQFYSNSVVNRMMAIINRSDADLFAQLQTALDKIPQNTTSIARIDALLKSVRDLNEAIYTEVSSELNSELQEFVEYESNYQLQLFENELPAIVKMNAVNAEQVYTAALSRPFQGRLLREWMAGLETDRAVRIRDAVRMGYVENQTTSDIVKRVRGTKALNYKDGIIEISNRNARTIIHTAISHMAGATRERFFDVNSEVIKAQKWSATLDGKTSETCRVRDGKLYDAKHKPIGHGFKWLGGAGRAHMNCRSVMIAVVKSWKELGIDEVDLPPSTRSSLDGQVPADITYSEWLKGRSASFQDEVLGTTKGKLFREGLPLDRFSNNEGRSYTLAELKRRDAEYFKKAGI